MSDQNEFSGYSVEELELKKLKFKKIQRAILILCLISAAVAVVVSISEKTSELYPVIGLILVLGIGYPLMAFVPIRKKIQAEIDSRA